MSGHSKWSTIKHRKAAQDQRRGKVFSRLAREITIAAREGGSGDPQKNPKLRTLMDKARGENMPSENISRAIDRGLGEGDGNALAEAVYEGYGPSGIAVICLVRTDNRQRTSSELKHLFEKMGGSLGGPGSAVFLFDRVEGGFSAKARIAVDGETREKLTQFLDLIRSHEDVTSAYTNAQLDDE